MAAQHIPFAEPKPKVLVFLGTSRQGAAVVDALLASGKFEVFATTPSAKSARP